MLPDSQSIIRSSLAKVFERYSFDCLKSKIHQFTKVYMENFWTENNERNHLTSLVQIESII